MPCATHAAELAPRMFPMRKCQEFLGLVTTEAGQGAGGVRETYMQVLRRGSLAKWANRGEVFWPRQECTWSEE